MTTNVNNRACIRRLSLRHMKAAPTRNLIAIAAIALTSVLFTAIFTVASSLVYTFEQNNFRIAGGSAHGTFKALDAETLNDLKSDPLIREYGVRHMLGMVPTREPFQKSHIEVSYRDAADAAFSFCEPTTGRLPAEGTNEAACDTKVLALLGVPAEIGAEFTLPVTMSADAENGATGWRNTEIESTFTLCGFWEHDSAAFADSADVLLPDSRVEELLRLAGASDADGATGTYFLDVMFKSASHIEENMRDILARHGFPTRDVRPNERDENGRLLPRIGVNWCYLSAQYENADPITAVSFALVLVIILFTGYLIIYNVFQISVANDIRFYGLLKTIGTTGRQLKRIVTLQALLLSAAGIPLGLLTGYGVGALFVPVIVRSLSDYTADELSVSPWIFIGAALFSLVTVIVSCRRPGRMAAKVSPVEAVRYTEQSVVSGPGILSRLLPLHRAKRHAERQAHTRQSGAPRRSARPQKGASLLKMAAANLRRNRRRTAVTLISLSLAVLLLNLTVTFTGGFDMEKYVARNTVSDFHVAYANYYNPSLISYQFDAVSDDLIGRIRAIGGVTEGGVTYGMLLDGTWDIYEPVADEAEFWAKNQSEAPYYPSEAEKKSYTDALRDETGRIQSNIQLYGMEDFCLSKLTVLDGDLSLLSTRDNTVAAVYATGDYGEIIEDSHYAKVGDVVTLRRASYENRDSETGRVLSAEEVRQYLDDDRAFESRLQDYTDTDYEVVAVVTMPNPLSYRYYGAPGFVMSTAQYREATGTADAMYYAFDVDEAHRQAMEDFLADFTGSEDTQYGYESRLTAEQSFASMRSMFLLAGGALSLIVGMIGVLNFFNTILTGILTRRREFAMLQSVGMTGRQLRGMLVREGVCCALLTLLLSFALILATAPFVSSLLGSTFWFFTYRFTALPALVITPLFLALGALLPLAVYRFGADRSVVERLRETE